MAKKKASRKGKKYDPNKNRSKIAKQSLKGYVIAWSRGMKEPRFFTTRGEPTLVTDGKKLTAMHEALPWSSLCIVTLQDQMGKQYWQGLPVHAKKNYTYDELALTLNHYHQQLLKEVNPKHLAGVAWITSPIGADITDELCIQILDRLKAWSPPGDINDLIETSTGLFGGEEESPVEEPEDSGDNPYPSHYV